MNKTWMLVVVAAVFEVGWVAGLKHANDMLTWSLTSMAIVISFGVLIYASKKLPASTVYAVFVGLGTAGTVTSEMLFFSEPFRWSKVALIALLLFGIIGLKLVSTERPERADREGDAA